MVKSEDKNTYFPPPAIILWQEAVFMCRKYEAVGTAIIAFGAGLLVSVLLRSGIWAAVCGIVAVVLGCLLAGKR